MDKARTKQGMPLEEGSHLANRERDERQKAYLQDVIGLMVSIPLTMSFRVW
jgi:hypothetical protein